MIQPRFEFLSPGSRDRTKPGCFFSSLMGHLTFRREALMLLASRAVSRCLGNPRVEDITKIMIIIYPRTIASFFWSSRYCLSFCCASRVEPRSRHLGRDSSRLSTGGKRSKCLGCLGSRATIERKEKRGLQRPGRTAVCLSNVGVSSGRSSPAAYVRVREPIDSPEQNSLSVISVC